MPDPTLFAILHLIGFVLFWFALVAKEKQRILKKLAKPQYADFAYFGHFFYPLVKFVACSIFNFWFTEQQPLSLFFFS